jgi:hypothetical protein
LKFRFRPLHLWILIAPLVIVFSVVLDEGQSVYCLIPGFNAIDSNPSCLMKQVTGLSCGSCGLTRSFQAIVRGKFLTATLHHALGVPLFFAFMFFGFIALCDLAGCNAIPSLWFRFYSANSRAVVAYIIYILTAFFLARIIGEIFTGCFNLI